MPERRGGRQEGDLQTAPCEPQEQPMRNLPNRTPRCLALIGLAALVSTWLSPASATKVYQYQNSAGETVFTDQPVEGATVHEVESAPVIPMTPVDMPEPRDMDRSE